MLLGQQMGYDVFLSDAGTISSTIERAFAKNGFKAPRFFDSLPSDGAKVIS